MILTKDIDKLRASEWAKDLLKINELDDVEEILYAVATKPVAVEITRDLFDGDYKWSVEPALFEPEDLPLAIYLIKDTLQECEDFCKEMNWEVTDVTDHMITMEMRIKTEKRAENYWLHKMKLASDTSQVPSIFHGSGNLKEAARQRVFDFLSNPCDDTWSHMARVNLIAGHVSALDVMLGTKEKPIFHGRNHEAVVTPTAEEFLEKLAETRINYIDMCQREMDKHQRKHDWLVKSESKTKGKPKKSRNDNPQVIEFPTSIT